VGVKGGGTKVQSMRLVSQEKENSRCRFGAGGSGRELGVGPARNKIKGGSNLNLPAGVDSLGIRPRKKKKGRHRTTSKRGLLARREERGRARKEGNSAGVKGDGGSGGSP